MAKFTNHTQGLRGIRLKSGDAVWLQPGASADIDRGSIVEPIPDLGTASSAVEEGGDEIAVLHDTIAELRVENDDLRAQLAAFLANDGDKPSAAPKTPVSLSNKSKDDLLSIAADEGVDLGDAKTNDDIKAAIELHREEAAKA